MKVAGFLFLLGFVIAAPVDADGSYAASNPVSRVVSLMKGLAAQVEAEGKKEEDLYESFVCWGKSVIEQKTASNSEAQSRMDNLKSYLADLDSGRVELTSERDDLEKEIAGLRADIETSTALRNKEHKEFLDARDEMNKAIKSLKAAVAVLGEATKDHKTGTLLAVRQSLNGGMQSLVEQQSNLKKAAELGSRFLDKADANFLRRLLSGEVPAVDWRKLNRKATFKMKYKARSFKIQDVLAKMLQTFEMNLSDATKKEEAALQQFTKLDGVKTEQLDASTEALTKMESETGARGMSKQDSLDEMKALKTQIEDDEKFIAETEAALVTKKKEWKDRQTLRSGELKAISEAIHILFNDDSRNLMKKSFSSQGYLFLQVGMTSEQKAASGAVAALRDAARSSGDARLAALASVIASPSVKLNFAPVLKSIDDMLELLKSDEAKDLEMKQTCEKDRMSDTRKARVASRDIDDMTDNIVRLEQEISELSKEIKTLQAEQKQVKDALAAATRIREDEHLAFLQTDKDDEEAAKTVKNAKIVLESFYKENNLVLAEVGKVPVVEEGQAPPPPPPTWEGDYGGKTSESTSIIAILQMVYEDMLKDRTKAKAEEDAGQKEYDTFKADSEKEMKDLKADENEKDKVMGKKVTDKTETEKSRGMTKSELDATLGKIENINPTCEYFEVNYVLRRKNRQVEIDGLQKARTILKGGTFTKGPNPNREIKPGDAANFLQRRKY